ncbi:hypothetical protein EJ04DRAFT_576591 [Polyplosphaeria fusca]|uniref:Uncharacterized protein n=1 Tax=Polyplosphaeria fusca TaxID=682080 RepID=A0A9P4QWB9_9PLEO|nr:hypothetical protein EJ04DRAFT_576591 [Polyplosphaeria fusca]
MTGRGDGRLIRPNPNASVKIGITLSASPSTFAPASSSSLRLVITAHILSTPRPALPITLMAYLNPFEGLPNRSIGNIRCTSPETSREKLIEIYPRGWPNYNTGERDLRKKWSYVTILPNEPLVIEHEIRRDTINEANLEQGENYQVQLTNKALGTRWWSYGTLEDLEGLEFRAWRSEDEGPSDESWADPENPGEELPRAAICRGENPQDLALVIEGGTTEIAIV